MKNQVIKCESIAHGAKIIKYWQDKGVDTRNYKGDTIDIYYGVINNRFDCYKEYQVVKANAEIITLPENKYPKVMIVSDYRNFEVPSKRVVFMEKCGKYLAWSCAETIKEAEKSLNNTWWNFAKDIEPENTITEVTLEDVAILMGKDVSEIRIKK